MGGTPYVFQTCLHLFLLKILGISMIFRGVGWSLVDSGGGGGPDPKKKLLTEYLLTVNVYNIFPIKCIQF